MIEATAGRLKKRFAERGSRTEGAVTCERERKLKTGLCVETKWERQRVASRWTRMKNIGQRSRIKEWAILYVLNGSREKKEKRRYDRHRVRETEIVIVFGEFVKATATRRHLKCRNFDHENLCCWTMGENDDFLV